MPFARPAQVRMRTAEAILTGRLAQASPRAYRPLRAPRSRSTTLHSLASAGSIARPGWRPSNVRRDARGARRRERIGPWRIRAAREGTARTTRCARSRRACCVDATFVGARALTGSASPPEPIVRTVFSKGLHGRVPSPEVLKREAPRGAGLDAPALPAVHAAGIGIGGEGVRPICSKYNLLRHYF